MSVYQDKFHCLLITVCPIRGQIYYPECAPCDGTCENPNPVCPTICKPGCACPAGQVVEDRMCVDKIDCPPGNTSNMSKNNATLVDSELWLITINIHIIYISRILT